MRLNFARFPDSSAQLSRFDVTDHQFHVRFDTGCSYWLAALVDAISASYSYFNALIGSTREARCAGMKPAHSATSASATADSASTAGSAPVI